MTDRLAGPVNIGPRNTPKPPEHRALPAWLERRAADHARRVDDVVQRYRADRTTLEESTIFGPQLVFLTTTLRQRFREEASALTLEADELDALALSVGATAAAAERGELERMRATVAGPGWSALIGGKGAALGAPARPVFDTGRWPR